MELLSTGAYAASAYNWSRSNGYTLYPSTGAHDRIFPLARAHKRGQVVLIRAHYLEPFPLVGTHDRIFPSTGMLERGHAVVARTYDIELYPLAETYSWIFSPAGAHERDLALVARAQKLSWCERCM